MTLSVIGAGLGRTGTTTLKLALERLGFGPCHHMVEVFKRPRTARRWAAAAAGESVDWEALLGGFRSCCDWPSAAFYRELADLNPDAKVILTEREPEAWFRSTQNTIFSERLSDSLPGPFAAMFTNVIGRFTPDTQDRDRMIADFVAHNAEVRRIIAPERLLVYRVEQGWDPLCAFLDVPVPDEPLPHANSTEDFHNGPPPGAPLHHPA